jgi:type IV pilus assembly protein PilM
LSLFRHITKLIGDPPPSHLFELSEAGLAYSQGGQTGFAPFEPGTLVASPVEDNVLRADALSGIIAKLAAPGNSKKRRPAAVILPDYAARVTVLDFDSFPSAPAEQISLIKFRIKKTIPFDIESAAVSYFVQAPANKRIEVVAVTVALEVIARYEALFRGAGYQPGVVTTSMLAALNLYQGDGVSIQANRIKLFRCLTLEESSEEEILSVLHPTFAYVEDELSAPADKLLLCGFPDVPRNLPCAAEPLRSRFGSPGAYNAGLLGYMEQIAN